MTIRLYPRLCEPFLCVAALLICFGDAFSPPTHHHSPLRSSSSKNHLLYAKPKAIWKRIFSRKEKSEVIEITDEEELDRIYRDTDQRFRKSDGSIQYNQLIKHISVKGDTQIIGTKEYTHPVVEAIHQRKRLNGTDDNFKIALSVEGGGMRGCISAGMVCALQHLGLNDVFDIVYGSSAGSITSAYFITGQTQWLGPEVYYDMLPTAGKSFIDTSRLLRVLGLGLINPKLIKDTIFRRNNGKPVLNLPFLLNYTVREAKPLDWDKLEAKRQKQPLNVIMSGLSSQHELVMNQANGGFNNLEQLTQCMHASCLLPGVAGPVMNVHKQTGEFQLGNGKDTNEWEPLADSLIYQPLPYRAALQDGATHVVLLRSRPDGTDVTGKGGWLENRIMKRFFVGKNNLPDVYRRFQQHGHKIMYARDILALNRYARSSRPFSDTNEPHVLTVALPPGSPEVARLESDRTTIFNGFRLGFARAYDCLVLDPAEKGRGEQVAREYFPDEILEYAPLDYLTRTNVSAFENYMDQQDFTPETLPSLLTAK